jgi:hypothetical protein
MRFSECGSLIPVKATPWGSQEFFEPSGSQIGHLFEASLTRCLCCNMADGGTI